LTAFALAFDSKGKKGMDLSELPANLAGEAYTVNVPSTLAGLIIGKGMSTLCKLMESTNTFIFFLSDQKGERVADPNEMDDLLEAMFDNMRSGSSKDLVIFGTSRAKYSAAIKVMAMIEEKVPGFYQKPTDSNEALSHAPGLSVDRVWLSADFEELARRTQADILAGAAGCAVESAG